MTLTDRFIMQLDLVTCDLNVPVCIIGAGGIGSVTALTLAKLGVTDITVYDDDKVEEHNLPNQIYREQDIGKLKVAAWYEIIRDFTGVRIKPAPRLWDASDEDYTEPVVLISAVDNMLTRRKAFEAYAASGTVKVFMDGRMGANQIEVYACTNETDNAQYKTVLWTDAETSPLPCTSKATMYTVLTIASFMASLACRTLAGEEYRHKTIMDMFNLQLHGK